jgi:hypothetical protein
MEEATLETNLFSAFSAVSYDYRCTRPVGPGYYIFAPSALKTTPSIHGAISRPG